MESIRQGAFIREGRLMKAYVYQHMSKLFDFGFVACGGACNVVRGVCGAQRRIVGIN